MAGSNWFGNLQLAYKYVIVFISLLVLTLIAGFIKVLFDRRKLKKNTTKEELESGPREDTVELTQREKDEGDLFGIRAIEAGFYAGVAQSRPTSRATSRANSVVNYPATMSSSTLIGGVNSPLMKGQSNNNSVLSLNLGRPQSPDRSASPASKLRPSEAELTGRHVAVDNNPLRPIPIPSRRSQSAASTDSASSDNLNSPRSMSPRTPDLTPNHYAPMPRVAMPDALSVSYHNGQDTNASSQVASFSSSPAPSPTPASPGAAPTTRLPTLPSAALRSDSRSPSPPQAYRPTNFESPAPAAAPTPTISEPTLSEPPAHTRVVSDASSTYSQHRASTFDAYRAYQRQNRNSHSREPGSADSSRGTSTVEDRRPSTHLALPGQGNQDSRLSEFYDAYYRQSTLGLAPVAQTAEAKGRQSTIVEVDTPLASPMFPGGPGKAL